MKRCGLVEMALKIPSGMTRAEIASAVEQIVAELPMSTGLWKQKMP